MSFDLSNNFDRFGTSQIFDWDILKSKFNIEKKWDLFKDTLAIMIKVKL